MTSDTVEIQELYIENTHMRLHAIKIVHLIQIIIDDYSENELQLLLLRNLGSLILGAIMVLEDASI